MRKASEHGIFVRLDMEDNRATQATIDATLDMQARGLENIGLVLQGRMFRTPSDISQMCETLGPKADFRICKGSIWNLVKLPILLIKASLKERIKR